MHICNATPIQWQLQLPPTSQTTTTSSDCERPQLETPIQQDDWAAQKNHAPQAKATSRETAVPVPLQEPSTDWEHALKPTLPLSDSTPMFNRKHDDPTPLVSEEDKPHETMRLRFKSPMVCRWLTNVRLQWRIIFYLLVGLAILLLLYAAMNRDTMSSTRLDDMRGMVEDKSGIRRPTVTVKIEVYMESQCPDTADFLDTQLMPTWNQLKEYMNLKVIPFGKARWTKQGDDDYSFQCQHGQNECLVNQLMCCGIDRLGTADRYLPYIVCLQLTRLGDEDEAKCARQAGVPNQELQTCANSKKGRQLHYQMGNMTKSLTPPLYFVPWVIIDGKREGGAVDDLKMALCNRLSVLGVKPAACEARNEVTTLPSIH